MAGTQEGFSGAGPLIREKLVRDGIPEGASRRAGPDELPAFLAAKVVEEASELAEQILLASSAGISDGILIEMADLQEVLGRVQEAFSLSPLQLEAAREEKRRQRGGFETDRVLSVPAPLRRLSNGTSVPLRPSLLVELARCKRADLAVAFIKRGAAFSLLPALREALSRGALIRILTTDYLDATDPDALEALLSLPASGQGKIEIRCFLSAPPGEPPRGYHPKAYLFERENGRRIAFVGSSNLSEVALSGNVEWNVFLRETDLADPVEQLSREFEEVFAASRSVPVDLEFVASYQARRRSFSPDPGLSGIWEEEEGHHPSALQEEVLLSLAELRTDGAGRALAILATGMGKTYLAAFDSREFSRVLFLAHRREILDQAQKTFLNVRRGARASHVGEGETDITGDLVFAQVQSLGRSDRLQRMAPDLFDYIVVDECHHAEAPSYRRILSHFRPKFVLGLTATPYRMDNGDIFGLMEGNVACRYSFMEGIRRGVLSPFRYFGLKDTVNFDEIPWRGTRYAPDILEQVLSDPRRLEAVHRAFREHEGKKTVAFCLSRLHARVMAELFVRQGIPADFLTGETPPAERKKILQRFSAGPLSILFVVDLLNEGVDIPQIDRVMLLRPTDSPTIFLQQIGRGLRHFSGKPHLTILDFIGNHRRVHYVLPALAGRDPQDGDWASEAKSVLRQYKAGALDLPPGVTLSLDWEVVDILEARIARAEPRESALLSSYENLWENLGHRPTLLETALEGESHPREFWPFFGSWHGMHLALEQQRKKTVVGEVESLLYAEAGDFLAEIERTAMSRSFKMVVFHLWLAQEGGLSRPVSLTDLAGGFRAFFQDAFHAVDLKGTEMSDLDHVTDRTLESYILKNPVNAWVGNNRKKGVPVFFRFDKTSRTLAYEGKGGNLALFHEALRERVAYRLFDYFQRRAGGKKEADS